MTDPVTIDDFEDAARSRLSPMAYDYYRSGADEEHTLRRNREAWTGFELWYRALAGCADASSVSRDLVRRARLFPR